MAKVRPNDPCPCGSGRKYKKCCQLEDDEIRRRESLLEAYADEGDLPLLDGSPGLSTVPPGLRTAPAARPPIRIEQPEPIARAVDFETGERIVAPATAMFHFLRPLMRLAFPPDGYPGDSKADGERMTQVYGIGTRLWNQAATIRNAPDGEADELTDAIDIPGAPRPHAGAMQVADELHNLGVPLPQLVVMRMLVRFRQMFPERTPGFYMREEIIDPPDRWELADELRLIGRLCHPPAGLVQQFVRLPERKADALQAFASAFREWLIKDGEIGLITANELKQVVSCLFEFLPGRPYRAIRDITGAQAKQFLLVRLFHKIQIGPQAHSLAPLVLVLLEQFAATAPVEHDDDRDQQAVARMLMRLREEHARVVAIWFGHPDPAVQEGDAQQQPICTRLPAEPESADIGAMLAAATHASFAAARYADVYSEALQTFSEPPATSGRLYTAADLGIARLQQTYPVHVDPLVEEEPPPGTQPEWPFVQRLLGHPEPLRWVWVPVEETPSVEDLTNARDELDDWLDQTLDYLRDGYWHTWHTITCLEQRIPVDPLVREITLGHLVTHEPDQRRAHSIDDSARPDVPWHEWTSRLATAMQWPEPMTPTDRIPWAMERGWLKLAAAVDRLAAGLVHPPGVTRSLDVIPRDVRESLWTQLIAYPLLFSSQEETAKARNNSEISAGLAEDLLGAFHYALMAITLDPGILDAVTVNHVLQKVALPPGAAERIAPHLCRTFDTPNPDSPIGSSHLNKLVQARVKELERNPARNLR